MTVNHSTNGLAVPRGGVSVVTVPVLTKAEKSQAASSCHAWERRCFHGRDEGDVNALACCRGLAVAVLRLAQSGG